MLDDPDLGLIAEIFLQFFFTGSQLLLAFYLQKKGMQEIAASFGYTNADNAKTQKYKCLMRLKKLFFRIIKTGQRDG